ncbi:CMP-N-acetylneuraminate-beta-galactosamide-alpha-2,3-sialyltransferase 1-like isoform X1 [Gadus chalcogrammus]|uniref:CMP-N-acetylneuraminate-beta-galactosamide- alpha-2,3-sialyltransferase 1-like isoform X1 n=1 Tax=Gadus chalcogrammus TaxID=1042646 RepID=UPI0024C3DD21|nr:CMP-N-acetylneuraminate-beta-galactosamide-alpha-2,3-sialyltransferase 1-like isoform X1 [Gadus chalcogrammus]XP_056442808.1 CMP-N-acetylneuraminate-beta-galactosamide-alpha-2,3-sialyltransferase 1-like isoform X1 [Gadus chalcogrammus]XP_056442809.1 CMP-N-acetylneuraminate-beta-galactosamide-alpha-2,3-sialyltransferase 1-like isoform X1 [Gadus chalcogrammus]
MKDQMKKGWLFLLTSVTLTLGLFGIALNYKTDKQVLTSLTERSSQLWHRILPQDLRLCACNRCVTDDDDEWFTKRFNTSINPFLSQDNTLSEPVFNWWKRLQLGNKNFLSYRVAELKVFEIFPGQESFMDSSPDRCRTCAVVGNSVNLLGSHYGSFIDFHDVVIRFNKAPTNGYEEKVGNKTTIRAMFPGSAMDLDNDTNLLFFPFKTLHLEWLTTAFTTTYTSNETVKTTIRANKDLVMVLNPNFISYVHHDWLGRKGKYPSSGFLGLMVAMHICDEVNVFGFGADRNGDWRHYWEKLPKPHIRTGVHGGSTEYKVIQDLKLRQKINFFTGF